MTRTWPMLLRFVLIFGVVLTALALLWTWIVPVYTGTIASMSKPIFRLVENPNVSIVDLRHDEIWILRDIGEGRAAPFTWFDRYTFFALIPLLALFAATPGLGWRRMAIRAPIGVLLLLVVHTVYLVVSVELSYAAIGLTGVGPFAARSLDAWQILVRVLWEAIPVLIWLAFTFDAWRRTLRRMRQGATIKQQDSEPVGSVDPETQQQPAHGEGRTK